MSTALSIKAAATAVERSSRTIERWITDGDLEVYQIKNGQGQVIRRYVLDDQLFTVLREKLRTNPTHHSVPADVIPR